MGMVLDGIAASEMPDSSAEVLEVHGCDISDLQQGRATLNWEHGATKTPADHIGRIVFAKKIFSRGDCDTTREREYWDFVEIPFVYIRAELFDAEGHAGALAAAAVIRHYRNKKLPILCRFSIEGSTLEQVGQVLKRTIARHVALTVKPANKSAISGVVSDGDVAEEKAQETSAVEDPLAFLIGSDAKKYEHGPDSVKLGGSPTIAHDPEVDAAAVLMGRLVEVRKSLEGGSYNAAPSSLAGGAALQRESLHGVHDVGVMRNRCKAALRDYDPDNHGEFKKYLKHQLPEASEEFLDHFADMVGDWKVTKNTILTKKEDADEVMEPGGNVTITRSGSGLSTGSAAFNAKQKRHEKRVEGMRQEGETMLPGMEGMAPALPPSETPEFKVRHGRRLSHGEAYFEHETGILHTADGRYKVYIPDVNDRGYGDILRDPKLNAIHDAALKNWVVLHRMLRSGKMPTEVVALAAMFSAMSPNTAVPIQELAFGHLMDLAGKPNGQGGFEGMDPTKKLTRQQYARYAKEWKALMAGQHLPAWERDSFQRKTSGIWTKKGLRHKIGLAAQKWNGYKNYSDLHDTLSRLVAQHGTDGRGIAQALNDMKARVGTKAKVPGEPDVKGFAPKTIRYLLGMLGYGNVVVPDTHFIRHTFGLLDKDPKNDVLKKYLWNDHNEHLLGDIDRYYLANHPAVAHTRAKLQQLAPDLGDLGEHALFPAFWLHWLTIQPHEERRGWPSKAKNAGTDHRVYWNAVKRVFKKYGLPSDGRLVKSESFENDGSMATRIAHAVKELEEQFGFAPATLALYSTMIPALLAHHDGEEPLQKAERLTAALRKSTEEQPRFHVFRGQVVEPGEMEVLSGPCQGERMPLVGVDHSAYHHVVNQSGSLSRVDAKSAAYRINREPVVHGGPPLVDSIRHGVPELATLPEQHELIHGLDLGVQAMKNRRGQRSGMAEKGAGPGEVGWRRSAAGHIAYVKPALVTRSEGLMSTDEEEGFPTSHREAAFYRLAKEFFGLGQHVPTTAAFRHPVTGAPYSAAKLVEGEHYAPGPEHDSLLMHLGHAGTLDKLALMDMVTNHSDRHAGNWMLTPGQKPHIHLIDNGLTLIPDRHFAPAVPEYWQQWHDMMSDQDGWATEQLHPEAARWAQKLSPLKLDALMGRLGVPDDSRRESVRRLFALKERIARGNVSRGAAFLAPFIQPLSQNPSTGPAIRNNIGAEA